MYDPARDSWQRGDRDGEAAGEAVAGKDVATTAAPPRVGDIGHIPSPHEADRAPGPGKTRTSPANGKSKPLRASTPAPSSRDAPPGLDSALPSRPGPPVRGGGFQDRHQVQEHYNTRPNYRIEDRKKSGIYGVRTFNNFIKSVLIDRYTPPYSVVLDLCCGRGGDLFKWLKAGINGLIGVDIADVSIRYARERYEELKKKVFWVDLCAGDVFSDPLEQIVHPDAWPVDVVSCQFALHYAFSSEIHARTALDNVSRALKRGGTFIGTVPNSEYLAEHLRAGETEWGNSIFQIKFDEPNHTGEFHPLYGHRYHFFLKEAVEEVPEYVVPIDGLKALAAEYGLKLELFQPFMEFFNNAIRNNDIFRAAEQNIIYPDGTFKIDPEQLGASEVYAVFAFVKE